MKNLTRAERHEIADLLEECRLWDASSTGRDEPDWAEVEAWTDRLRLEAGPIEPTSHAARYIVTVSPGITYEWARHSGSGLWHVLDGSRTDGIVWDDLIEGNSDKPYTIIDPQEG